MSALDPDPEPQAPANRNRNVTIAGRRTSIRLDDVMWAALLAIAEREGLSVHALCTEVNQRRAGRLSLTSALRIFALTYFWAASTDEGHQRAGHGQGCVLSAVIRFSPPGPGPEARD